MSIILNEAGDLAERSGEETTKESPAKATVTPKAVASEELLNTMGEMDDLEESS